MPDAILHPAQVLQTLTHPATTQQSLPTTRVGRWSRRQVARFIYALQQTGNVAASARVANMRADSAYVQRDKHAEFRQAWDEAMDIAKERVELEIFRRAVIGWDEPVFYQGQQVGTIRKYSDRMLELLAKAVLPEKYRESLQAQGETFSLTIVRGGTSDAERRLALEGTAERVEN